MSAELVQLENEVNRLKNELKTVTEENAYLQKLLKVKQREIDELEEIAGADGELADKYLEFTSHVKEEVSKLRDRLNSLSFIANQAGYAEVE